MFYGINLPLFLNLKQLRKLNLFKHIEIFTIVLLLTFFLNDPVDTCESDDQSDNIEKGHSNVLPKASLTC